VVQGYQTVPDQVVVTGRTSVRSVNGTTTSIIADEYNTKQDGTASSGKNNLQLLAKFTPNSTQQDIDKISADLKEQGYTFSIEKVEFTDGKLVRFAATISKGKEKSSFNASDFQMLMIIIQTKDGKSNINVHISNGKISV
jgi:hypothetical protein